MYNLKPIRTTLDHLLIFFYLLVYHAVLFELTFFCITLSVSHLFIYIKHVWYVHDVMWLHTCTCTNINKKTWSKVRELQYAQNKPKQTEINFEQKAFAQRMKTKYNQCLVSIYLAVITPTNLSARESSESPDWMNMSTITFPFILRN